MTTTNTTPSASIWSLAARPVFRRVWLGELISAFGDTLTWLALAWFVLELTNDGTAVGAVLLCFALPSLFTGPFIGKLLDRYQPRTIMIVDNIGRGFIIAAIPALYGLGALQLWMVYALALFAGALAPATRIGSRLLVPWLVQDHELEVGNAALSLTGQLPTVLGPALAGVLISAWGATNALWLDALSFWVLAWALLAVPNIQRKPTAVQSKSAFSLEPLRRFKLLPVLFLMSGAFFFAYGPLEAALPILAKTQLHTDAGGYGLIWSACGLGMVLGSLATNWLSQHTRIGTTLCLISVGWGVCQTLIALSPNVMFALAAMGVGGAIWGPYLALEASLIQRLVPTEQHGQVFGLRASLMTPTAPLGTAVGGAMLSVLPPQQVIIAGALLCICVGLVALALGPLRRAGAVSIKKLG
jgi:MFS family permease